MSKYKIQLTFQTQQGSSVTILEVQLPDFLDSKMSNANRYKDEIIAALNGNLQEKIGGHEWRKKGWTIRSINSIQRL